MRVVDVANLKGNEILAKQIFTEDGKILLNAGVKLTPFFIEGIKKIGAQIIYIDDEISKGIEIEESISEKTKQESKQAIKSMVEKSIRESKANKSDVLKSIDNIIHELRSNKAVMINVAELLASDHSVYAHSLNVCVLATIVGTHMGFNNIKLKEIATGALLHDIGKIIIMSDKKVMSEYKSQSELDRFIEQNHPKIGYDFLTKHNFCSAYPKTGVLMHHERNDGSGYPLKLKGNEIIDIAQLISICDVFSNMVSVNTVDGGKSVNEVMEFFYCMSGVYFNAEIVKIFTANIAAYPNGSGVILNTKEKCLVVRQNKTLPLRPVVKVVYDGDGGLVEVPYEIDLCTELTLLIEQKFEFDF